MFANVDLTGLMIWGVAILIVGWILGMLWIVFRPSKKDQEQWRRHQQAYRDRMMTARPRDPHLHIRGDFPVPPPPPPKRPIAKHPALGAGYGRPKRPQADAAPPARKAMDDDIVPMPAWPIQTSYGNASGGSGGSMDTYAGGRR